MQIYILYKYGQRCYISSNLFDIYLAIPDGGVSFYEMNESLINQGYYKYKEYHVTVKDYE